jgi:Flp pilus assembly secretin CpaC
MRPTTYAATLILLGVASLLTIAGASRAADRIDLTSGFTTIIPLDQPARTIAIGNAEIVDAVVGEGGAIVLTGRAAGVTNLIVLGEAGKIVASKVVHVGIRGRYVTVRSGKDYRRFLCTPSCEPEGVPGKP